MTSIKYALFSLSDTTAAIELAAFLQRQGLHLLATASTAKFLRQAGITVKNVADFTGAPEILDGRVKTLHPQIHGSLLYCRHKPKHQEESLLHKLCDISVLVVNLYPFAQIAAQNAGQKIYPQISHNDELIIENIDIGGPALLRSAAKNYRSVSVLCQPRDYADFIAEWQKNGHISLQTRCRLAATVYGHTAHYDAMISSWFNQKNGVLFPQKLLIAGERTQITRYGENPHQTGAIYQTPGAGSTLLTHCQQIHGKEMSYNNFLDAEAALGFLRLFSCRAAVIIKHQNPCGSAIERHKKEDMLSVYARALACDTISAFGGIVASNRKIHLALATKLCETFYEIILAPDYSEEALDKLQKSKKNLRLLRLSGQTAGLPAANLEFRSLSGGFAIQKSDDNLKAQKQNQELAELQIVSQMQPTERDLQELLFAWKIASRVKSNAIVFAKDLAAPGIGAGQMSRIDAVKIAAQKMTSMGFELAGCYMASDAFLPFRDTVDLAAKYGVLAIIQPGGSVRDSEVIKAADEHGIIMIFTGVRHFYH